MAANLGDDADNTVTIYGQLVGAFYGAENLPNHWLKN
ncbi:ADP-ribosylglycohydrolase family protein [Shewanella baltica]